MNIIRTNEFIEWAFSDLLTNALRGVLAEYIVGKSIGALDKKRVEWDAYDLEMNDGIKIEVKSSAYIQTWNRAEKNTVIFLLELKKRKEQINPWISLIVSLIFMYSVYMKKGIGNRLILLI